MPDATPRPLDSDGNVPPQRRELADKHWAVLGVIAVGGMLGALARYGLTAAWPHRQGGFAWADFTINVTGCLLIGALMVLVTQVWTEQRLVRPFLGVGVLGGYTSFSAYVLDVQRVLAADAPRVALAYLAGTLTMALVAVWAGAAFTQRLIRGDPTGRDRKERR